MAAGGVDCDGDGMRFAPVAEALTVSGHPSAVAFDRWCRRFPRRFPDAPIIRRRYGCVDLDSLRVALEFESEARSIPVALALSARVSRDR